MTLIKINDKEHFKEIIMKDKSIIMIHKDGCPFCKKAMPWMQQHAEENSQISIAEVNEKDIREILEHFQVQMYPTFVSFSNGKVNDIFFGNTQKDKVEEFVKKNI